LGENFIAEVGEVPQWRDKFAIVGIGETDYSRESGMSTWALGIQAAKLALDDAGLSVKDIDGIIEGQHGPSAEELITTWDLRHLRYQGKAGMGGGAGNVHMIQDAIMAIISGMASCIICTFALNGSSETRASKGGARAAVRLQGGSFNYQDDNWLKPYGVMGPPQWYGPLCRRYMHEYGLTSRQLGAIAVTCRKHACLNEKAKRRTPITIEDHQNSPMVVDPFRRLDFSVETDGGCAFIVTSVERAKNLKQPPVYVMGIGEGHPQHPNSLITRNELAWGHKWAAPKAYKMAGVTPDDIDFAEIYEGLTYVALIQLPSLGFCKPEDAGPFCEEGNIELGGKIPVNTHGGLLSQAHIWGMNHICEAVKQLRGMADAQVKDAEIGMVTGAGDFGDGTVVILRR